MLVYYVFDLLYLDGHDQRDLPLLRRKELLARSIEDLPAVRLGEHIGEYGTAFFASAVKSYFSGSPSPL